MSAAASPFDRLRSAFDRERVGPALAGYLRDDLDLSAMREAAEQVIAVADAIESAADAIEAIEDAEGRDERADARDAALDALGEAVDAINALPGDDDSLLVLCMEPVE